MIASYRNIDAGRAGWPPHAFRSARPHRTRARRRKRPAEPPPKMAFPCVGPVLASAIVAAVPKRRAFKSGRKPGCLDRPRPAAELQRRQGATGRHHPCGRCAGGHPTAWNKAALVGPTPCPSHHEDRRGRARQQDGAYDLGNHDERRALRGATAYSEGISYARKSPGVTPIAFLNLLEKWLDR